VGIDIKRGGDMGRDEKKPSELYPRVAEREEKLNALIQELTNLGKAMLSVNSKKLYTADFFLLGVLNRSINLIDAVLVLGNHWNFIAAGPLVRVHLDTLLRISYWKTLRNDTEFLRRMLEGEQINNIKDEEGKWLTDARLRVYAKPVFPQVDSVYKETSKLIHFSDKHVFSCMKVLDDTGRKVTFSIGRCSSGVARWSEEDILILLECVIVVTDKIIAIGRGWVTEKSQINDQDGEIK
jgi:hypothetical protein